MIALFNKKYLRVHENKISLINVTSQPNQFPIWLPASFTEIFHWTIAFNILEENFLDWSTFNHLVKSNFPIQSLLTSIFSDAGNLKSMLMALHCIALHCIELHCIALLHTSNCIALLRCQAGSRHFTTDCDRQQVRDLGFELDGKFGLNSYSS